MSQLFWYTARAGGIVAWALLGASVIWGLWLSGRVRPLGARPAWILDLHRFLGGLATIFVGVHVASILLDSYTELRPHRRARPVRVVVAPARGRVGRGRDVRAARGRADVAGPAPAARSGCGGRIHVASLPLFVLATDPLRGRRDRCVEPDLARRDRRGDRRRSCSCSSGGCRRCGPAAAA